MSNKKLELIKNIILEFSKGNLSYDAKIRGQRDELDEVIEALVVFGEILSFTTVKREELEEKVEVIKKQNKELEQFAYIVSHDLKSPLRGISILSDIIREDNENVLDEKTIENFGLIQKRIAKMYDLIDGILKYSKVGHEDINTESINLLELLKGQKLLFNEDDIEFDFSKVDCEVRGSLIELEQVFGNLFSNSIHHSDKKIKVSVYSKQTSRNTEIIVEDNGIGIPYKYKDKIFEMFESLKPDKPGSTGIGLAVVKKVIQKYKGSIELLDSKGGAKFKIVFPKSF